MSSKVLLIYLQKTSILDFGDGGKISMCSTWLMNNSFCERKFLSPNLQCHLQYYGHLEDQNASNRSENLGIPTPLNILNMTNASGKELTLQQIFVLIQFFSYHLYL